MSEPVFPGLEGMATLTERLTQLLADQARAFEQHRPQAAAATLPEVAQLTSSTPELQSKLKQLVPDLNEQSRVVIVVCGGSNVTIGMASEYRDMLAQGWV